MSKNKPSKREFELIARSILDPVLIDIEIECKITEAYEYLVSYYEKKKQDDSGYVGFKLTGENKDKKIVSWFKKNNAINKIRVLPFFNGRIFRNVK